MSKITKLFNIDKQAKKFYPKQQLHADNRNSKLLPCKIVRMPVHGFEGRASKHATIMQAA